MKAIIASISALMLLGITIIITINGCPQPPPPGQEHGLVLIQGFDISISAQELCKQIRSWTMRLYSQLPSNAWLVACKLSKVCTVPINMRKGLPQPEEISGMEFIDLFAPDQERGTRPLRFLEYALSLAKQYPDRQFIITFFTDGENDYKEDSDALQVVCQNLIDQPNVVNIGLFGLDEITTTKGADWNGWFHGSSKAIVATSLLGCTERGINQLCDEAETILRANQKGR